MTALAISQPRVLVPAGDRCGEGALWHGTENAVYWTDINRFLLHRFTLADRCLRSWEFEAPVVALSLTTDPSRILVALASGLRLFSPETGAVSHFGTDLEDWPRLRLNDGRADPAGRFWVGSMRSNVGPSGEPGPAGGTEGRLFCINSSGKFRQMRDGIGVSNTLAWSPDKSLFYFADTLANVVWVHDYDLASGEIGVPRVFFEGFERGYPDGSTIDAAGYLWNCRFGGGCIVRLSPAGDIDRIIDMPVTNPTTATFGGDALRTLFVTSAEIGARESERHAGCLFALDTNVAGLPENRFEI